MDIFWKSVLLALVAAILGMQVNSQNGLFAVLLTLAATILISVGMADIFRPVLQLLNQLESIGNLQTDLLSILLKALGIGITSEIASLVCSDAGNASISKMIQLSANAAILYISIPVFSALLELLKKLMINS